MKITSRMLPPEAVQAIIDEVNAQIESDHSLQIQLLPVDQQEKPQVEGANRQKFQP